MTGRSGTRWLDADEQAAWRAFIVGSQLLLERLDRDLRAAHGITHNDYEILVRLSERPGRQMRMAQLADSVCHSRSRLTHAVKRLEAAGLLRRESTAADRRGVVAVMTDRGRQMLVDCAPTHVEGVRRNLFDLADPADFAAVGRVFDAVSDLLLREHPEAVDIR